jgi:hypothetical protein
MDVGDLKVLARHDAVPRIAVPRIAFCVVRGDCHPSMLQKMASRGSGIKAAGSRSASEIHQCLKSIHLPETKIVRRMKLMSRLTQLFLALSLISSGAPAAFADMPPPQVEAVAPTFGFAGILITVAIVIAGLWLVTRMQRMRKEKELLAAGGTLPSTAAAKTRAVK